MNRAEICSEIYAATGDALPPATSWIGKDLIRTFQRDEYAPRVAEVVSKLPGKYVRPVIKRYAAKVRAEGVSAGNVWLRECVAEALERIKVRHAQDDEAIRAEARRRADDCARILGPEPTEESYGRAVSFSRWHRVSPPPRRDGSPLVGAAGRLSCELWWRRKLRVRDGRAVESLGRDLNLINRRAECYASDEAVERRRGQKARNRALMAALKAENDAGHVTTMEALHDHSISNPALKRAELMTRIRGFEDYAKGACHVAEFFTVSCPSKYHRSKAKSGLENPRWNGSSPRSAQHYLCALWARVRAALARHGIRPYGFRIAEPHHDGCPHWHLLLFVDPAQADTLAAILEREALREDGTEPGAAEHRFKRETIDPARGTAAGYIAKYVAKNIDGHKLDYDMYGNTGEDAAVRVDAWASTWGIRQFQQIGGPPVGVWRELRRCRAASPSETVERARAAADNGEWEQYVKVQGLSRQRGGVWPVRLLKEDTHAKQVDTGTGEITTTAKRNRYGEVLAQVVIGVTDGIMWLCSRLYSWKFSFSRAASAAPWTCVNNCTPLTAMEAGP